MSFLFPHHSPTGVRGGVLDWVISSRTPTGPPGVRGAWFFEPGATRRDRVRDWVLVFGTRIVPRSQTTGPGLAYTLLLGVTTSPADHPLLT